MGILNSALVGFVAIAFLQTDWAQTTSPSGSGGAPRPIAEKIVKELPQGPLYWSVTSFATLEQAKTFEDEYSLAAASDGKAWLFTLGPKPGTSSGTMVAQAGPITPPKALRYLLRISESITAPGRVTPVHSHPGSEAFYVLKGAVEYKTPSERYTVSAGSASAGPPPGTTMQATTVSAENAHNLIMFVLDADKPAQAPAAF